MSELIHCINRYCTSSQAIFPVGRCGTHICYNFLIIPIPRRSSHIRGSKHQHFTQHPMNMFKLSRGITSRVNVKSSNFSTVPSAAFLPLSEVTERVLNVVRSIRSSPHSLSENDHFVSDLGFDSLVRKTLNMKLNEEFCITPAKGAATHLSVQDAVSFFSQHPKAR